MCGWEGRRKEGQEEERRRNHHKNGRRHIGAGGREAARGESAAAGNTPPPRNEGSNERARARISLSLFSDLLTGRPPQLIGFSIRVVFMFLLLLLWFPPPASHRPSRAPHPHFMDPFRPPPPQPPHQTPRRFRTFFGKRHYPMGPKEVCDQVAAACACCMLSCLAQLLQQQ